MPEPYLFINYRKKDAVVLADSLHLMLRDAFGDVVFLDSSELEKGAVFPPRIEKALNKATCLLVLIGGRWLRQYDERTGIRRLDLPDDWVKLEIERALQRSIDVIPVLAPETSMPLPEALPESIRSLHERVPILLRAQSYVEDRQALIEELAAKHGFRKRPRSQPLTSRDTTESVIHREPIQREAPMEDPKRSRGPKAWVNGTVLHYFFFQDQPAGSATPSDQALWGGKRADIETVRNAFEQWKSLGIGLDFEEVTTSGDAEVRIGFATGEGSWSYIGRDSVDMVPAGERTMNFGWSLTGATGLDTALHEIGHILGLAEEHQNPNAGIVWDEAAVCALMQGPPNHWSHEQVYAKIIHKGDPSLYYGPWDPDSIMHFPFSEGLILEPTEYRVGLHPYPGLSPGDKDKIRFLYPPLTSLHPALVPLEAAPLSMQPGEQANFTVVPNTPRAYNIQTFGPGKVVMMLFEDRDGELATLTADDNTGQQRAARIEAKLDPDQCYILRVRLFKRDGDTALMMW